MVVDALILANYGRDTALAVLLCACLLLNDLIYLNSPLCVMTANGGKMMTRSRFSNDIKMDLKL